MTLKANYKKVLKETKFVRFYQNKSLRIITCYGLEKFYLAFYKDNKQSKEELRL